MKINKNRILAFSLALLIMIPTATALTSSVYASNEKTEKGWPVEPKISGIWYKFETPLITLLFPAGGRKPMFIWWYTEDNSTVYTIKFQGVIEYLAFDKPYYVRRFSADDITIRKKLEEGFIEPKIMQYQAGIREGIRKRIMTKFLGWLFGLHPPYLPFSGCQWSLEGPKLVTNENTSYWSFNFTLTNAPPIFDFADNNVQIRCRFYNTTTTETPDENYPNYNYTVAAGQLKFDFVVSNWKWNIDKINPFLEWLKENYGIEIPVHKTGLALWVNMASIKIEEFPPEDEPEAQNQFMEQVENKSCMEGAFINNDYYGVTVNETQRGMDEKPVTVLLKLKERFRHHVRVHFAYGKKKVPVGFLEFVPWARLLYENGTTYKYVNVTASYIAAGHHLRLFICYPYFGNYTLEHDPTIGLASAPPIPTLLTPEVIGVLLLTTIIITIAILAYKRRKQTINIISP